MDKETVNIHGKQYETVASRVHRFIEAKDGFIRTELFSHDSEKVIVKASIVDEKEFVKGTGYAEEYRTSSNINKTSALENCETSAIGRALASIGYAGTEYASADEVANAVINQGSFGGAKSSKDKPVCPNCKNNTHVYPAEKWGSKYICGKKGGGCGHKWPLQDSEYVWDPNLTAVEQLKANCKESAQWSRLQKYVTENFMKDGDKIQDVMEREFNNIKDTIEKTTILDLPF